MKTSLLLLAAVVVACGPQKQDGERAPPDEDAPPVGEVMTCEKPFVAQRQTQLWYKQKGFGDLVACDKPKTMSIQETTSIPIYYAVLATAWTPAEAASKMEEARTWFQTYCINVPIYPVTLRQDEPARWAQLLARANGVDRQTYAKQVGKIYKALWEDRMGRPADFLLVLFVDDFKEIDYADGGGRINSVAGNFENAPVILVPSVDVGSTNIITHELVHGLGKGRGTTSKPPSSTPWGNGERKNTWDEGACSNDMGNAQRANPRDVMTKPNTDLLDWASYWQFGRVGGIR